MLYCWAWKSRLSRLYFCSICSSLISPANTRCTISYMCYPGTDIPIRRLSASSLFLKFFGFFSPLHYRLLLLPALFSLLISILHFPHYNTTEEFISCIKQAERVVFFFFFPSRIQSFNFTPSLVLLRRHPLLFFLTSDDLWFLFSRAHS